MQQHSKKLKEKNYTLFPFTKTIKNIKWTLLMMILLMTGKGWGQYSVTFEGTGETKTAYASGTVSLSAINWDMTEALIGTDAADWKNGSRSARMRGYGTSSMTMLANKSNGLGTISFSYRRYGTDAQVDWKVEYSIDNGSSWTQIGSSFTAPASDVVQTFSEAVNVSGDIRVRIKRATESGTSNKRLNIDNIVITDNSVSAPTVTSSAATSIAATSATFNGNVTSDGGSDITERGFVYKTSAGATISDNKTSVSGTTGAYTLSPTLAVNTRYFFKAYAINAIGTTLSSTEQDFWTLANVPSAPTVNGATTTSLNVAVNVNSNPASTEFAIQETTSGQYVQAGGSLGASAAWQTASSWGTKTVTGLNSSTSYTFQVKARNGANVETVFSNTTSETTSTPSSPTITVGSITAFDNQCINTNSSEKTYNVSGINLTANITVTAPTGYQVSTTSGSGFGSSVTLNHSGGTVASTPIYVRFAPTAVQAYSGNITHASTGATTQNVAVSGSGINTAPTIATVTASSISTSSASSGGNTISAGCANITAKGVVWGTSSNPTLPSANSTDNGSGTSDFTSSITGLSANTTYHYRAYATSSAGTSYGSNLSFTTLKVAPTTQATNISFGSVATTSLTANWTNGNGDKRIVIMNTSNSFTDPIDGTDPTANPAYSGSGEQVVFNGTGTSVAITGLTQNTEYWFRVYEYNNTGVNTKYITSTATDNPKSQETIDGPCLTDASGYTGWTFSGATSSSNQACSGNGILFNASGQYAISPAITNPDKLNFNKKRSGNSTAWELQVQISESSSGPWTTVSTITAITNSCAANAEIDLSSYSGTRYLKFLDNRSSGPHERGIDDITVMCNNTPMPEINLKGNDVSIASGSAVPSEDDHTDFGNADVSSGTVVRTFTIENTGTADLLLTGSSPYVSISGTNAADFSVTAIPTTPISASSSTTFQITFDPSAVGLRTASISIANDDSDENPYTFAIQGTGVNSMLSDIIVDGAYSYSSNIDYTSYQGNPATNTSNSIGVFKFTIRDGGGSSDGDAFSTELNAITFNVTNIANIRSAALFGGGSQTTMINNSPTINTEAGTITFTGLSGADVTANDDDTKSITLRVSFLSTVTDNQQLQFTIASANANSSGSVFASANAGGAVSSTTGDINRIEVTATKLGFSVQPTNSSINVALPSFTVATMDANNNIDLDASASVTISSIGTGLTVSNPYSLSSGVVSISDVVFSDPQSDITLTAASASLSDGTSNTFSISEIIIPANSYRSSGDGTWPNSSTSSWERYVSNSWTGTTPPGSGASDVIYISHTITSNAAFAAPIPGSNMVIENGGVFNAGHNCTFASLLVKDGGTINITTPGVAVHSTGTITIESGGKLIINSATLNNADNFWAGTENFKNGSTLEIQEWDWSSSSGEERLIDNSNIVSENEDGYYFGNIIITGTPTKAFTLIGKTGTHKLCQNNLTINNLTSGFNVILTNVDANIEIGGDVIAQQNTFSFGAVGSFDITHNVKGNIVGTGGTINLNQNNSGTASVTVNLEGNVDIPSGSSLISTDGGCKIVLSKSGTQTLSVAGTLGTNVAFDVASGSTTQLLGQNLSLSNASNRLSVLSGGVLEFNNFNITGSGGFELASSGTLKITSADGVNASGNNTGNVQCTGTRTYSQSGFYHYVGSASPQSTGTAITSGSTAKQLVINKTNPTDIVNLTQSTGTTSKLEIIEGIFAESESAQVSGSGELIMSGGEYRMSVLETTLPQLSGTYTLTGGTINLNGGLGNQTLRGGRDYYSLTFSGGGTKYTSSAITNIGDNVTLNQGLVTIKDDNTILDIQNSGFSGNAGLSMQDNSTLRMRRISASLPELDGVYTLTGGTVELYGSESTQNHTIRGTDGAGSRITYNNVNLNATAANTAYNDANIIVGAGFTVNGTLNINNPACVRIASTLNISGPGTFNVNAGATLKYGSVDGITASANAGNVRTTNRNFSPEASYGFAGISSQVTGDGLPTSVKNIYVDKTDANATVTLTNSIAIETALVMNQGHIITGSNTLELGNSTINKGSLSYSSGYVVGKMRRWFNSTNSGISSGLFPMAVDETGLKNRNVLVEYTSAPSAGGSLTTEWVSAPMGARGLPIVSGNTGGCSFDITSAYDDGFWKIDNASGTLTDGAYSISVTGEGLSNIENLSELTLLKRVNGGNWFCPGNHNEPTGSVANPTISRTGVSGWSNFGFGGGDANPLPVELISFEVVCKDKIAVIQWTTATEVNNSHFVVEYSIDAVNWNYLTTVQGSGNSSTPINYEYTSTQNKFAYFRLIQVDFDGQQTIYGPINSNCSNESSKLLTKIYPNPFNQEINLFVDDAQSSFFVVEMMDMNGRVVQRNEFFNQSQVVLSTQDLVKGVYTIRVISHSQTETFKVIKQ